MDIYKRLKLACLGAVLLTFFITAEAVAGGGSLVSAPWLAQNMHKANVVVLDVSDFTHYEVSHIPGAVKAFGPWMTMNDNFVGFMMPKIPALVRMIKSYGVNNNSTVIIYGAGVSADDTARSARALWTFEALGHNNVAILNGGFAGWVQQGGAVSNRPVTPDNGNFSGRLVAGKLATLVGVRKELDNHQVVFVDNRMPDHFFGKEKNSEIARFGHIPGARLWPAPYMTNAGVALSPSYIKDVKVLRQMAAGVGIPADKNAEIITYSDHGRSAAMGYFVLHDMLGYNNVKVYDGSILQYAAVSRMPMARYSLWYQAH
ncbi:MAG: sulfurtransferase [Deltaproteobacteria bacterium]|nr:sulfurtransferase [Deltaproteobacteria bacterium]